MSALYPPWPSTPAGSGGALQPVFISYAQNFEDVILWRALHRVGQGFYIDIGAGDPDAESVTRAFYDRGWHGVNVEPSRTAYLQLVARRPRDININAAVLDRTGPVPYYPVDGGNGLSTIVPSVAAVRRAAGWPVEEGVSVDGDTLSNICRRHAVDQPIHFLKIDVEGAESEVLLGADFSVFRPWLIVVESEGPGVSEDGDRAFEEPLLAANYRSAYFDGLNRFYIAREHADQLTSALSVPPNVYDRFVPAAQVEAEQRAQSLAQTVNEAWAAVDQREREVQAIRTRLQSLEEELLASGTQLQLVRAQVRQAAAEREAYVQQLFEGARYEAWLAQERARLGLELAHLESFQRQVLASRSWRLTGALRRVGQALRAQH